MIARPPTILLTIALLLSVGPALPARAAALKTYTDTTRSISIRYPSTWTVARDNKNIGFAASLTKTNDVLISPDSTAIVAVLVQQGRLSAAAIKSNGIKLFKDEDNPIGRITMGTAIIGGTRFTTWSGTVKYTSGAPVSEAIHLYIAVGSKATIYVSTAMPLGIKNAAATTTMLEAVVNTITIH